MEWGMANASTLVGVASKHPTATAAFMIGKLQYTKSA
jgi:hypothetical protein